jgi:gas vesicle protein
MEAGRRTGGRPQGECGVSDKGDFLAGLLVGGLVGALVGLLVAPAPGPEMRRRIAEQAGEAGSRVRESAARTAAAVRAGAETAATRAGASVQQAGRLVSDKIAPAVGLGGASGTEAAPATADGQA